MKQRQRRLGLRLVGDAMCAECSGQGAAHQHPRAVADPVAHPLDARPARDRVRTAC